ncbi:hypothetical protein [Desulfoferrobacter suflitae]|uniref:hypothetical protein n=1 Tax=Desulfoferrobacter suflitae TaxID=2865782 RepID=UPI002164E0FD|nr:hypothetical protein [Desulfoferrobacter suflitae]MCK8603760.1 hypothetical protein [Desulfoferrobacter suflitae]
MMDTEWRIKSLDAASGLAKRTFVKTMIKAPIASGKNDVHKASFVSLLLLSLVAGSIRPSPGRANGQKRAVK